MRKTIALMTGGGDCPGLNAAIRTVVRIARHEYGDRVIGIEDGYEGLIEGRYRELDINDTRGILRIGGTILGSSNRTDPTDYTGPGETEPRDRSSEAFATLEKVGAEALIVVGGDGTMLLTHQFAKGRIPVVGIPKTIDNDVHGTDYAIGFQTCITTVTDALDKLHTTAESHHRIVLLEVMGRSAGWVALFAGIAGGADIILIPERAYSIEQILDKVRQREARGSHFTIGVIAEGSAAPSGETVYREQHGGAHHWKLGGVCASLANALQQHTSRDVRGLVLGHIQRGGSPVVFDRLLATQLGSAAIHAIHDGADGVMVGIEGSSVKQTPLSSVAIGPRRVPDDHEMIRAAETMGLYVGNSR
ncbi:MAG TPA: ATP-dependent 6-phosphofructokinase [Thermomicrobiales bacterium]|nr:6-phosphofructokinase [Chloroflexota bacterium]HCG28499.1 6-phosphofructokinase [Chloroflexota bacterium]HQX61941.1 ATP-dependent 6-phosphofructokinase [Thermomicrobiales bacterium]HQZ88677.1 ATP-dependent 6-phosphofructokinase [Thermomicrobiales bacterium]HRA32026.1 ATP-dependent 6-phosphofructokinase [Thermomicrobiales bacterium]